MPHEIETATVEPTIEMEKKTRCRSFFAWAQLLISLSVPLAIIAYTVIQNNNDFLIAEKNREQDLKIANETRLNDLTIAEINRQQDLAIAKERYEHDLKIAQQRYEHDVALAIEEQEEAMLVNYFDSLTQLLKETGMNLSESVGLIARMKTLITLRQINSKRKSILVRALIESRLIVRQGAFPRAVMSLSLADLSGVNFTDNTQLRSQMDCADLVDATLTNAYFRNMLLTGVIFRNARLHNSDLSGTTADESSCGNLGIYTTVPTDFSSAVLDGSIFDNGQYEKVTFIRTSLISVQMRTFRCKECNFQRATFDLANMSHATFEGSNQQVTNFELSRMNSTILHHAYFYYSTFSMAIIKHTIATFTHFNKCYFSSANLLNSSFVGSTIANSTFTSTNIEDSSWARAKIINTLFINTRMNRVDFNHIECYGCLFNATDLSNVDFTNAILVNTDFTGANVTYAQLKLARTLENVTLPNGTIIT